MGVGLEISIGYPALLKNVQMAKILDELRGGGNTWHD